MRFVIHEMCGKKVFQGKGEPDIFVPFFLLFSASYNKRSITSIFVLREFQKKKKKMFVCTKSHDRTIRYR